MTQTILSEPLSFLVETCKNVQYAGSIFTPTAGIGIRICSFRMDLAGGEFDEGSAIASGARADILDGMLSPCFCFIICDVPSSSACLRSSSPAVADYRKCGKAQGRKYSGLKLLRCFLRWQANTTVRARTFNRSCPMP